MRNDRERMRDIQEAILKIEKYANRGKEEFFANELTNKPYFDPIKI